MATPAYSAPPRPAQPPTVKLLRRHIKTPGASRWQAPASLLQAAPCYRASAITLLASGSPSPHSNNKRAATTSMQLRIASAYELRS